jgi:beta-phosphoglucomutase
MKESQPAESGASSESGASAANSASAAAQSAPVDAVIYDLDGVLVSTDEYHYRAWKRMADEEGIPFDRENNERLRGVSRMESLAIVLERADRDYSDEERHALAEKKNNYYVESLRELGPDAVLPGALDTVAELKTAGVLQAVASSSKNAPLIMKRTGLASLFEASVDGTMISRSKPDPEVFLKAAEALGMSPAVCIVVEDAVAGVQAGNGAGMRCFAVGSAAAAAESTSESAGNGDRTSIPWRSAECLNNRAFVEAVLPLIRHSRDHA